MQLEMGSTPAPGVASRRPRRVAGPRAEPRSSESVRGAEKVTGEGASHDARGGRAPPLPLREVYANPLATFARCTTFCATPRALAAPSARTLCT